MALTAWLKHFIHDRAVLPADRLAPWLEEWGFLRVCCTVWEHSRALYPSEHRPVDAKEDVRETREAVRKTGAEFHAAFTVFHDPHRFANEPRLRPVDAEGIECPPQDWYRPLSPADPALRQALLGDIEEAIAALAPDGVLLDFCRWPFFWEKDRRRDDGDSWPLYDFSETCLREFSAAIGREVDRTMLASGDGQDLRARFLQWRTGIIHEFVRGVRSFWSGPLTVQIIPPMHGVDLLQSRGLVGTSLLDEIWRELDVNPCVMLYHEVLGRDVDWALRCLAAIGNANVPCLPSFQTSPAGPAPTMSAADLDHLLRAVSEAGLSGFSLFSTKGLLEHPQANAVRNTIHSHIA